MNFSWATISYFLNLYFLGLLCIACTPASSIVPSRNVHSPLRAVAPEKVGIYRVMHPYPSYKELGVITLHFDDLDLPTMYEQLRKEAGAYGAEAVVDVKIKSETHKESETKKQCTPENVCNSDGICSTKDNCTDVTTQKDVSSYLVLGTLIRRNL